jgi:photosystem II stability/assembly factor-like uncharacterized protein
MREISRLQWQAMCTLPERRVRLHRLVVSIITSLLFILALQASSAGPGDYWTQTKGPFGGLISALGESKTTGSLFAVSPGGGVFRSTDHGSSWHNTSLNNAFCQGFTSDSAGVIYVTSDSGLFRSTDDGADWSKYKIPAATQFVECVTIDALNRVYVGSVDGLYRSTDMGNSWLRIDTSLVFTNINQIAVNSAGDIFAAAWGAGLFRSGDDGHTWQLMFNTGERLTSLVVTENGNVYFTLTNSGSPKVLLSTDNGVSWSDLSYDLPPAKVYSTLQAQDSILIVGTDAGVFTRQSDDTVWINRGVQETSTFMLFETSDGEVFAATFRGIYVSTDWGFTWEPADSGLCANFIISTYIDTASNLYLGTYGGDLVYRSTDQGTTWLSVGHGIRKYEVQSVVLSKNGLLFAAADNVADGSGSLFQSSDFGQSWKDTTLPSCDIRSLAVDTYGAIYAAGGNRSVPAARLYRSSDEAKSWVLVLSRRSSPFGLVTTDIQGAIMVSSDSGMYRSTDHGESWNLLDSGLDKKGLYCIAPSMSGAVFAGSDSGVYSLFPGSTKWVRTGLLNDQVTSMTVNKKGFIYAGNDGKGLFKTTDMGSTWNQANSGLLNTHIGSLTLDSSGYLYAGTFGTGLFKSTVSTTSVGVVESAAPSYALMEQNYPNPFNPTTRIQYSLTTQAHVTLTVYDLLGRQVKTLVNDIQRQGKYSVLFDGRGLSSGVYYYQLRIQNAIMSRTMILLK